MRAGANTLSPIGERHKFVRCIAKKPELASGGNVAAFGERPRCHPFALRCRFPRPEGIFLFARFLADFLPSFWILATHFFAAIAAQRNSQCPTIAEQIKPSY